ncbi:stAR-related lipid transfer protein 7, mitochondrial isoform 1-T2 [Cochliomyia hominivorax]
MIFKRMLMHIKHSSNATLQAWCYQCESILAQRSRRLQQLFTFYHRVYGSHGLKQLIRSYHRQLPQFKGTNMVLSAVGVVGMGLSGSGSSGGSGFDWNAERLSLTNFDVCQGDLEFINNIKINKLCDRCKEYNMKYCYCLVGNKKGNKKQNRNGSTYWNLDRNGVDGAAAKGKAMIEMANDRNWEPYFSKDEFQIWRREERTAMYSYKVYASFNDISAADLLHVQVDLDYRKQWDDTAVALNLIEEDPLPDTNSHLIYWEMQWPKFFNNRDYVYCRRFICDDKRKVMMVANRGTQHPEYPQVNGKVRVTDYWSFMVIKPYRNFQEPGVHYILTYYDDPGLPIPQSIKSWVAQKQMPDILQKMYYATKNYSYKKALAMRDVFSSFSVLNNEYAANKSRDSWLQRLWRQRRDEITEKSE